MSYKNRLKEHLAAAVDGGIISAEQAKRLIEQPVPAGFFGKIKAVHWMAAAAGGFTALGLILIVASNWNHLGATFRVCAYLLLFAAAAEGSTRVGGRAVFAIPLEVLWFFLPVLGIGLYAQTFQLSSGDPIRPFLAWAVLSIPLVFVSGRGVHAYLSLALLLGVLYFGTMSNDSVLSLTERGYTTRLALHFLLALAVLAAAGTIHFLKTKGRGDSLLLGAVLVWVLLLMNQRTLISLDSEGAVLLAGTSAAVIWVIWGSKAEYLGSRLPLLVWTGLLYGMTFFWKNNGWGESGGAPEVIDSRRLFATDPLGGAIVACALLAAALASLAMRKQPIFPEEAGQEKLGRGLLAASIFCALLLVIGSTQHYQNLLAVLANLILIGLSVGLMLGGVRAASERPINLGIALLAGLALTRFLHYYGSMLDSGFGFIFAGIGLSVLAYLVNRGRKALVGQVKK